MKRKIVEYNHTIPCHHVAVVVTTIVCYLLRRIDNYTIVRSVRSSTLAFVLRS